MIRKYASLLVCMLVACTHATADEVDVYLLGGQSNMQGNGLKKNLPGDFPREIPYTFITIGAGIVPLTLEVRTSKRGRFGPEIGFGLEMATAERPVYLAKYAASGQPLYHGWSGSNWIGEGPPTRALSNFYPGRNADDPCTGKHYRGMLGKFKTALKLLEKEGHTPLVRGFVWMQGEQDAKNKISASVYATSLERLRERLCEDMRLPKNLPMVFGQVLPTDSPKMDRFHGRAEIHAQMAAADQDSGATEAIENCKMVSTLGFGLFPDKVHFTSNGQLRLGRGFAKAMKELLANGK